MSNGNSDSTQSNPQDSDPDSEIILIVRVRHFLEFETPIVLRRTQEFTIYNSGETLYEVVYNTRQYLPHLSIFDFDGKKLVFHSDLEDYNQNGSDEIDHSIDVNIDKLLNTDELTEEEDFEDPFQIIIEFPDEHPFLTRQFRTITYSYIHEIDFGKGLPFVKVPLGISPHFYLHVKKMNQFKIDVDYLVESADSPTYSQEILNQDSKKFRIDDLDDDEQDSVSIITSESYSSFSSKTKIDDCKLVVGFNFNLHPWDKNWFDGGIALAIIAFLVNLFFIYHGVKENFSVIVAIVGIVNSYLIITKGWLFMKDMDRFTNYTTLYLTLIFVIFAELVIAILLSIFDFSFMQNIYIVIDQQIKMNVSV